MEQKNKTLIKNIGIFSIGSFGSKIIAFLLIPLYTSVLSVSDYGTVDLVFSTASLLTPILMLSIQEATLRFALDFKYRKKDVLSTSIKIITYGTCVLIAGVLIFRLFIYKNFSTSYLIFLVLVYVLGGLNNVFNLYLKAQNDVRTIVVSGILCTVVTCLSNILSLVIFNMGVTGYMISNIVGILAQDAYQLIAGKVYKDIYIKNYSDLSKPMLKYSTPLIANSVSWWVNNASDRYILTFFRGVSENGIYSVAYKIPTILTMLQGIFYNAWSVSAISEFDENDSDGFIGKNYSVYSFVSLVICSGLILINIPLAMFLYKGEYFRAWKYVPILLVGTVFSGISSFEGSLFAAVKDTKTVAKTTVIGAFVNTICNVCFIYYKGALGAAIATLIGYIVTWLLRTIHLKKYITMKVNWKVHFLSLLLIIFQMCIAILNINLIFQFVPLIFIILLNKNLIVPIVKKVIDRSKFNNRLI